jgi:hypothetical protein
MKHPLSVHIAPEMGAFACAATTLDATFGSCENRMPTVALRRGARPTDAKRLKKRHFSATTREKSLAKAHACAIFRADSPYAATVARVSQLTNFFEE